MLSKIMEQQQQTNHAFDYRDWMLGKILNIISKQQLLPGFLDQLDAKCIDTKKKRLVDYQQKVKKIYSQKNKFPLIYDPQQALTQRQKLLEKIQKSQNHELDIEYFQKMRLKQGKIVPTYKGFPLDTINYPTRKEFEMFHDFDEKKFLKSYSQMFDDKLQLKELSILRKQRVKTIGNAIPQQKSQMASFSLPKPKFSQFSVDELKQKQKDLKKVKKVKLRPLTDVVESERSVNGGIVQKVFNDKYKPHLQKITVGKVVKEATRSDLYHKMLQIGSFPISVSDSKISLTKQSLAKYLKQFYERQIRIIDFLQIKPTISLDDYCNLYTKVKLMSVEHVIFMTFLFYDSNNDGYICDNDIRRVKALVKGQKNLVLEQDLKLIERIKEKKQFHAKILARRSQGDKSWEKQKSRQNELNYHELYKLPEVTQSTFFQWLNRQKQRQNNQAPQTPQQQQISQFKQVPCSRSQSRKLNNPFNPSVMKFKYNYFDEKAEVKKYILNIKATKTYINFWQFRKKYIQISQETSNNYNKQISERRTTEQSSRVKQSAIKDQSSLVGVSRYQQLNRSLIKVDAPRKQSRRKLKQKILRPFLWYDLLNKLAGVKYQGLKYE